MPEKDKLSWIKRRKTTGNIQPHAQMKTVAEEGQTDVLEGTVESKAGRPLLAARPASQPSLSPVAGRSDSSRPHDGSADDTEWRLERILLATERNADATSKLQAQQHGGSGYFDTSAMAVHFGKITDLLARNIEHMESMSQRQFEHEQRLTVALEDIACKRKEDRVDLTQLTAHLDRVNRTLEHSAAARRDSARHSTEVIPALDFTSLTPGLEKVQQATEQNALLTKQLLGERSTADAEARYKNRLDLLPTLESLEKIHAAVETQNLHAKALLEMLRDDKEDSLKTARANGSTLHRILQAQMETKEAIEHNGGDVDFTPIAEHMDAMREVMTANTEQIQHIIWLHKNARPQTRSSGPESIEFSPTIDRQSPGTGDAKFLMSALSSHLSKLQAVTEQNAVAIKTMHEKQVSSPAALPRIESADAARDTNDYLRVIVGILTEQRDGDEKIQKTGEDTILAKRVEATSSQVRELVASQREMVGVVRELALSITTNHAGTCGHIVIPPPRKMGRKVVGFVYDD